MTNSNAKQTMKAVSYSSYGGPEVLETHDVPVPEPTGNQVRLVIRAAGVNPIDWKLRSGSMAEVMSVQFPKIPGSEVAGVVDAVGPEATGAVVGDEGVERVVPILLRSAEHGGRVDRREDVRLHVDVHLAVEMQ